MSNVIPFRQLPDGHRSGRSKDRGTPTASSISGTSSAVTGVPLTRNREIDCCEQPIKSANADCDPANVIALSSASTGVLAMPRPYQSGGELQQQNSGRTRVAKSSKVRRMKKPKQVGKGDFGRRVRELREKLGISQSALGKAIGVSQQTVNNWEIGRTDKTSSIVELARALCTSPEWLQTEEGAKEVRPFRPADQVMKLLEQLGEDKAGIVIEFMRSLLRKPYEGKALKKNKKRAA